MKKIKGLKKTVTDFKLLEHPVILYDVETGGVETCREEDCLGDAFLSLPDFNDIEDLTDCLREDFEFGRWPSDEISENNIENYILWKFPDEGYEAVNAWNMARKIIGLEEAIKNYNKAKTGRWFHGSLMYNKSSGEVWTDFSYDEDMSWNRDQKSGAVVNIGEMLLEDVLKGLWGSADICIENIQSYIKWKFSDAGGTDEY